MAKGSQSVPGPLPRSQTTASPQPSAEHEIDSRFQSTDGSDISTCNLELHPNSEENAIINITKASGASVEPFRNNPAPVGEIPQSETQVQPEPEQKALKFPRPVLRKRHIYQVSYNIDHVKFILDALSQSDQLTLSDEGLKRLNNDDDIDGDADHYATVDWILGNSGIYASHHSVRLTKYVRAMTTVTQTGFACDESFISLNRQGQLACNGVSLDDKSLARLVAVSVRYDRRRPLAEFLEPFLTDFAKAIAECHAPAAWTTALDECRQGLTSAKRPRVKDPEIPSGEASSSSRLLSDNSNTGPLAVIKFLDKIVTIASNEEAKPFRETNPLINDIGKLDLSKLYFQDNFVGLLLEAFELCGFTVPSTKIDFRSGEDWARLRAGLAEQVDSNASDTRSQRAKKACLKFIKLLGQAAEEHWVRRNMDSFGMQIYLRTNMDFYEQELCTVRYGLDVVYSQDNFYHRIAQVLKAHGATVVADKIKVICDVKFKERYRIYLERCGSAWSPIIA